MTTTTSNLEESKYPSVDVSQFRHTPFYCEENVYMLCKKLLTNGIADVEGSDLFVVFISNEKKQRGNPFITIIASASGAILLLLNINRCLVLGDLTLIRIKFTNIAREGIYYDIPLWHQKASHRADGIVLWDYHVICIQRRKEDDSLDLVWDLDSNLPFPSPLASYASESIRPSFQLFSEFQRFFRIVHAPIFLRSFASDRRHMKDYEGNWMYPPPSHEAIVAQGDIDVKRVRPGEVRSIVALDKLPKLPLPYGTVHNLNEYMDISTADVVQNVEAGLITDVFTSKFGVVVGEDQLEKFFSLIP